MKKKKKKKEPFLLVADAYDVLNERWRTPSEQGTLGGRQLYRGRGSNLLPLLILFVLPFPLLLLLPFYDLLLLFLSSPPSPKLLSILLSHHTFSPSHYLVDALASSLPSSTLLLPLHWR